MHHRLLSVLGAAACMLMLAASRPSHSTERPLAAPQIMIFHGGPLPKPITIASWEENHRLLLSDAPLDRTPGQMSLRLTRRPVVQVALFWGSRWRRYAADSALLATLTPSQATQHGQYYPANRGQQALLAVGSLRVLSDSGLAVLRRHGVPTAVR